METKQIKNFSPQFYRFLLAGIIILAGFYIGINVNIAPKTEIVKVKNVSASVAQSVNSGIILKTGEDTVELTSEEISNWIEFYTRSYSGEKDARVQTDKVKEYVTTLAPRIDITPVNAKFEIADEKVKVFQPAINGERVNIEKSTHEIVKAIRNGEKESSLVIEVVEPDVTLEKINTLGINTLLGRGESNFAGSSPARIHNIKVGMSKFNGVVLKPGEEFSFNEILGEVDEKSGYQPELVIKGGKTVLEYGGGICQVSTTLFRSAIYSGLPISERRAHSFPVRYYNPQGFDSTIYPGVVDLKFVNDTPNHVLIQNKMDGTKLVFEIYGSDDGREVKVEGPYQYDQKSNGAMKAYFVRKIHKENKTDKEERFDSSYRPPPASPLERNPLE